MELNRRALLSSICAVTVAATSSSAIRGAAANEAKSAKLGPQTSFQHTPLYAVGQHVKISLRYPWGHYRTPMYIRGKVGYIERQLPEFLNPEQEAYGKNAGTAIRLYRVRFPQRDIWPDYKGGAHDQLQIEMYEHWIEPA